MSEEFMHGFVGRAREVYSAVDTGVHTQTTKIRKIQTNLSMARDKDPPGHRRARGAAR